MPDVLLLILLGLFIGPTMLGVIVPDDFGKVGPVMTTVALTVILFESGTSLKLTTLGKAAGATLTIGLLTFLLTVGAVAAVGYLLTDLTLIEAILLGSILGGTSAAVVIPMVNALGMGEGPKQCSYSNLPSRTSSVLFSVFLYSVGLRKGPLRLVHCSLALVRL